MLISNPRTLVGNHALSTREYVINAINTLSGDIFTSGIINPDLLPPLSITTVEVVEVSGVLPGLEYLREFNKIDVNATASELIALWLDNTQLSGGLLQRRILGPDLYRSLKLGLDKPVMY